MPKPAAALRTLYFAPASSKTIKRNLEVMREVGLEVQWHAEAAGLQLAAARLHGLSCSGSLHPVFLFGVLAGQPAENAMLLRYLRGLHPTMRLLSIQEFTDATMAEALNAGADLCCPSDPTPELLQAALFSLLRQFNFAPKGMPAPETWVLRDNAWQLEAPCGRAVPLTTQERAFITALTSQPGLSADHQTLQAALRERSLRCVRSAREGTPRIGLLVSRLKRKVLMQHGIELPLKNVHNWGYMFNAALKVQKPGV